MLRWLGPRKAPEPPDGQADRPPEDEEDGRRGEEVTDDPLASAFGHEFQRHRRRGGGGGDKDDHQHQIYSVSRSVLLPRVSLLKNTANANTASNGNNNNNTTTTNTATTAINTADADGAGLGTAALIGGGVNPLFQDPGSPTSQPQKPKPQQTLARRNSPQGRTTNSSGYGSSHISLDEPYPPPPFSKLRDDAVTVLEQNPSFVKSIKIAAARRKPPSSSSSGTLTTIPEGKVDSPIPKPIWPRDQYDSIVDDALLLYTSLNYVPGDNNKSLEYHLDVSVKELLVDLLNSINEGTAGKTPEEMLKMVNEKIALSIETLKISTEEEMKKLCLNLSNCKKLNSVLRAFSSGSSGHSTGSSRNSPEWSSSSNGRVRTSSGTETSVDDIYQIPSGSSSSGFSDFPPNNNAALPIFIHEDIGSVPNGVRNAMIYGTLYRAARNAGARASEQGHHQNRERLLEGGNDVGVVKKSSLRAVNDNKPSVWEQYYGVKAQPDGVAGGKCGTPKPTDVPLFPGGRPEADFTLDVPRSELLSRRMKEDKKWRCRCRLLTSFLGLVFFLLSVMAVSLILTRGKRMFGSMM